MAKLSKRVGGILDRMTLDEMVGQVFVFTYLSEVQALHDLRLHPGGYIRLISDVTSVARQSARLQSEAAIPLVISADFERGVGPWIAGGTDFCTMMALGATQNEGIAERVSFAIATEARAIGVNLNYVPVMDVNINPANPIINTRAFGASPELVARMGCAVIRGHRRAGVLTCAKHFPGHGDTCVDSHTALSAINVDRERLDQVELYPFREAIAAGVDMIMSAHLLIPALDPDPVPATLSRRILTDFLRGEMGFEGVVTSDALEMGAIAENFSIEEATVLAFNAGCDQLIMPTDNAHSIDILKRAVARGEVAEGRLREAVGRILALKERAGLLEPGATGQTPDLGVIGCGTHRALALEACEAAATLIRSGAAGVVLPHGAKVAVITFSAKEQEHTAFLEPRVLGPALARIHEGPVDYVHVGTLKRIHQHELGIRERALNTAAAADIVVVGAFVQASINRGTVGLDRELAEFTDDLRRLAKPTILASFGSPYIGAELPWIEDYFCVYSASEAAQEAAARALAGRIQLTGRLPVALE